MREILFRGKTPIDDDFCGGEWVQGFYTRFNGTEHRIYSGYAETDCGDYYPDWYEVIPETVGQYTGLTDKHGKKIFEGDIFKFEDDIVAVVIFDDGSFRLKAYGWCGTYTESGYDETGGGYGVIDCESIDWYYVRDLIVIGNIHDNPKLFKGGIGGTNHNVSDELMAEITKLLITAPSTILAVRDDGVCIDTSDVCICCGGSGKFKSMQAARTINGSTVRAEDLMITCPVCCGTGRRSDNK